MKGMEARRRRGRLEEDAGGPGSMLGTWLAKGAFIAFLVWLLQHPLPGMLRALAYSECMQHREAAACAAAGLCSAALGWQPAAAVLGSHLAAARRAGYALKRHNHLSAHRISVVLQPWPCTPCSH